MAAHNNTQWVKVRCGITDRRTQTPRGEISAQAISSQSGAVPPRNASGTETSENQPYLGHTQAENSKPAATPVR